MAFIDNFNFTDILWIFVLISFFIPLVQKRMLFLRRQVIMRSIETKRTSLVISMILLLCVLYIPARKSMLETSREFFLFPFNPSKG